MLTPRQRGTAAERELMHKLEDEGWLVIRSAGSGGPYDLIALNETTVALIQVKLRKEKIKPHFLEALRKATAPPCAEKWLATKIQRKGWHITKL